MPRKITIKKSPATKERVVVKHSCTQKESIKHLLDNTNKLSVIITGNGEPDKGLCRQVALIGERQKGVLEKLGEIHTSLNEYHTETVNAKETALTVKSGFERYKTETESIDKERKEAAGRVARTIGIIIAALGLITSTYFAISNNKKITNGQEYHEYKSNLQMEQQKGYLPTERSIPMGAITDTAREDTTMKK